MYNLDHHHFEEESVFQKIEAALFTNTKTGQFAERLKNMISELDDEEIIVKKTVDAALSTEFGKLKDKKYLKLYSVISEALLNNDQFKAEAVAIAKDIMEEQKVDRKKIIN